MIALKIIHFYLIRKILYNNLLSLIQFLLKYKINERISWDNFIKFSLEKNSIDKKDVVKNDDKNLKRYVIKEEKDYSISKEEISDLMKMDKSMCIIRTEKMSRKMKGTGFFCKMDKMFPIKFALFTSYHLLNEKDLKIGKEITFNCLQLQKSFFSSSYKQVSKKIIINEKRKIFVNEDLDYICIELFESDGIKDFFEIDPKMYGDYYNKSFFMNLQIFILYFKDGYNLSFSQGKILSMEEEYFYSNFSTSDGADGAPIICRCQDNYVIGLYHGKFVMEHTPALRVSKAFYYILNDIKQKCA